MEDNNNQSPIVDIKEDNDATSTSNDGDSKFIPTHLDSFEIEGEEDEDEDELTSVNTFDILDGEEDEEEKEEEPKKSAKDMTVNPFTDEKIQKKPKKKRKKGFLRVLKKVLILLITLIIVCAILFGVYWFFIKDNEDFKKEDNTTTEVEVNDENETNDTTNTVEIISGYKPKAVANTKKYEDRVMEQLMSLKQITTIMISKGDKEYQFHLNGNTLFVNTFYKIFAYGNIAGHAINVDHTDIVISINGKELTTIRNKSIEKIVQLDGNYLIMIVKKPDSNNVYENIFVDVDGNIVKTIESNRPNTVPELIDNYTFTVNTGVMGEITGLSFYKNGCNKVMKYDISYDALTGTLGHEDVSETEFENDGDKTGC